MSITRKDLAGVLRQKTEFTAPECAQSIDQLFETIVEALERGEYVKISGFGNFRVREKRGRKGRNPKTGEQVEIRARRVVTFKPSLVFRKMMEAADQGSSL